MVERAVLLPGVTTLTHLVATIRDRAALRLWRVLARAVTPEQRSRLETLLLVPEGARHTTLDRLRRAPTRISAPALVTAVQRVEQLCALGVGSVNLARVPRGRLKALARTAASAWAPIIARVPEERRVATLLAFATVYEVVAQDDALDVYDQLMTAILARAVRRGQLRRLRRLHDLDAAA